MTNYVMSKLVNVNNGTPFEELGIEDSDFIMLEKLKDKDITLIAYKKYVKDESDGIFMCFEMDGQMYYTATHAVGIVKTFDNEEICDILNGGSAISARIVQKKSKKSGRMYFCFDSE